MKELFKPGFLRDQWMKGTGVVLVVVAALISGWDRTTTFLTNVYRGQQYDIKIRELEKTGEPQITICNEEE